MELFSENGKPVSLKSLSARKYRGTRLPGADLEGTEQADYSLYHHFYNSPLFGFSLLTIDTNTEQSFQFRFDRRELRLQVLLTGGWQDKTTTEKIMPGQYRLSLDHRLDAVFSAGQHTEFLVFHLHPELIAQLPLSESLQPSSVKILSEPMREIIHKILRNPYEDMLRQGLYDYSVRELIFYHLARPPVVLPGELSESEMALAYEADRIIAASLDRHYTIHELARMLNTNVYTLKNAFSRLFGMGTFERLQKLKMEHATYLLEQTDEQIQSVAYLSGYETVTGFINSFREHFGVTPREWRNRSRGKSRE